MSPAFALIAAFNTGSIAPKGRAPRPSYITHVLPLLYSSQPLRRSSFTARIDDESAGRERRGCPDEADQGGGMSIDRPSTRIEKELEEESEERIRTIQRRRS
jgi:hypothetical protein